MSAELLTNIADAVRLLAGGGVLVYPTETFFGIGCDVRDARAVDAVFRAKRRQSGMALPVILGDASQLGMVTRGHGAVEAALARDFWLGPLSILCPALPELPDTLTGGTGRVAVRVSPHPAAMALALGLGAPLAASSANVSGRAAVVRVADLDRELLSGVDGVYDAPPQPAGGLPSTLVDVLTDGTLRILREGAVPRAALVSKGYEVVSPC